MDHFRFWFQIAKSKNTIIWNKFIDIVTEIGTETGLLAVRLTVNRNLHPVERLFWLAILCTSIYYALTLSRLQLLRYMNSATVVSVDRDYRNWNGSLPAVSLCYYDHIDSFKASEFIQDYWNVTIVDEDYSYFMDFLYAVVNASAFNYADLTKYSDDERFNNINLYDLIQKIDRAFEQVISSFDSNFEVQVLRVMTERGFCYAINSPMSQVLNATSMEYKNLRQPLSCQFGKQQCYIRMDLYESSGTIDVHSPFEITATGENLIALHKSDEVTASFKILETVASKHLHELTASQRKCVFNYEAAANLRIYSKSLCLSRCRAVMALEMCNCVPFFYPYMSGTTCNPAGFECLLDFKWPIWALHICECPSTCTEIEYTVQNIKKSSWGVKNNEENADVATSSFRWDLIPPKVRLRRDVVFSFEDLVVSFGGALAFFIGISGMAVIQLGYVISCHFISCLYIILCYILHIIRQCISKVSSIIICKLSRFSKNVINNQ